MPKSKMAGVELEPSLRMTQFIILFMLVSLSSCATSTSPPLKILGISTLPSPSHHVWFTQLMKGLARNGHQIYALSLRATEINEDESTGNRTKSIVFEGMLDDFLKAGGIDPIKWSKLSLIGMASIVYEDYNKICEAQIATKGAKQVLELMKNTKIDVIVQDVTNGQCFYGLWAVAKGNPSVVGYTPFGSPHWVKDIVGGNNWPAIKQFPYYPRTPPFNLWEKTLNFIYYEIDDILRKYYFMPIQQELSEKLIGEKLTESLDEMEKHIDVMLTNSYAALDLGIFLPPNAIEVGGLHVRDPKPLPQDIEEFLDGAEHGAIVISLGTNVKCNDLGSDKLEAIVAALSQLNQRVLWKFENDHLPNRPENVMIKKWLPQNDVLTHPKVRVLWSHAGLLSTQEAVWRGIPMIGMPFYMDQSANIDLLVKKGVGLRLDFETLTVAKILETFDRILNNTGFALRMKQLSLEYRDRPMSPLDLAVWHIEHAARHPRGPLASPGRDLNRLQLNLLDVYAVLGLAVLSILCIFWLFLRALLNAFRSRRKRKTD